MTTWRLDICDNQNTKPKRGLAWNLYECVPSVVESYVSFSYVFVTVALTVDGIMFLPSAHQGLKVKLLDMCT